MAKYSLEEWEDIAKQWREAAGQNSVPRLNAIQFIKWLKRAGYIKDYICVPDKEMLHAEGSFDPDRQVVFYRETSWEGAERETPHHVRTLVHEGCHGILKHGEVRYRADAASALRRLPSRARPDEVEADTLTSCILAPYHLADFKPGMTIEQIMLRFGISRRAAEIRLDQFEKLYRRKHGLPRDLPPGVIDFLTKQKEKGFTVKSIHLLTPDRKNVLYDGDPCPSCGAFKLLRTGLGRRCDTCGAKLGED